MIFKRFSAGHSDQIVDISTTEVVGYLDLANSYSKSLKTDISVSLNISTGNIIGFDIIPVSSPNQLLDSYQFSSHLSVSTNTGFTKIVYSHPNPTQFFDKTGTSISTLNKTKIMIQNTNGKSSEIIFSPISNSQRIE